MFKKKGIGLQWEILIIATLVSIGIILFYSNTYASKLNENYRGEFSIEIIEEIEKNKNFFSTVESIMNEISKQSVLELESNWIPQSNMDCGNYQGYNLWNKKNLEFCLNDQNILQNEFMKIFDKKFQEIKPIKISDISLSNINYEYSILYENEVFSIIGKTEGQIELHIIDKKERSLKLFLNPSFKVPINFNFNDYYLINQKLSEIIDCTQLGNSVEECTDKISKTMNNFDWEANCDLGAENIHKFCIKNNKKELKNQVIKLAAYIPDMFPSEVKNLQVFDRPKDKESFILKWDANKESDVIKYRVYFAESSLKIFENKDFEIKTAKEKVGYFLVPITCDFDPIKNKCFFTTSEGNIEFPYDNILFFKEEGKYYVSFKVSKDTKYDFYVTAIDRNGNEIENINKIITQVSKNDLP